MAQFLIYAVLSAAGLFFATLPLAPWGDDWLMFGLVFGGAALASLRILWEKLDSVEKKLDELLKKRDEHDKP